MEQPILDQSKLLLGGPAHVSTRASELRICQRPADNFFLSDIAIADHLLYFASWTSRIPLVNSQNESFADSSWWRWREEARRVSGISSEKRRAQSDERGHSYDAKEPFADTETATLVHGAILVSGLEQRWIGCGITRHQGRSRSSDFRRGLIRG